MKHPILIATILLSTITTLVAAQNTGGIGDTISVDDQLFLPIAHDAASGQSLIKSIAYTEQSYVIPIGESVLKDYSNNSKGAKVSVLEENDVVIFTVSLFDEVLPHWKTSSFIEHDSQGNWDSFVLTSNADYHGTIYHHINIDSISNDSVFFIKQKRYWIYPESDTLPKDTVVKIGDEWQYGSKTIAFGKYFSSSTINGIVIHHTDRRKWSISVGDTIGNDPYTNAFELWYAAYNNNTRNAFLISDLNAFLLDDVQHRSVYYTPNNWGTGPTPDREFAFAKVASDGDSIEILSPFSWYEAQGSYDTTTGVFYSNMSYADRLKQKNFIWIWPLNCDFGYCGETVAKIQVDSVWGDSVRLSLTFDKSPAQAPNAINADTIINTVVGEEIHWFGTADPSLLDWSLGDVSKFEITLKVENVFNGFDKNNKPFYAAMLSAIHGPQAATTNILTHQLHTVQPIGINARGVTVHFYNLRGQKFPYKTELELPRGIYIKNWTAENGAILHSLKFMKR